MTDKTRRTIRRYAHELYPDGEEATPRPLAVEVPFLYARAQGLEVWGTSWFDLLDADQPAEARTIAVDRTNALIQTAHLALLADALLQGMSGQEAWDWAEVRMAGDSIGEWVWERGKHYGVDLARIKPYPCGPEPATHDHMASTGNVLGDGVITRIICPESECPDCTEEVTK